MKANLPLVVLSALIAAIIAILLPAVQLSAQETKLSAEPRPINLDEWAGQIRRAYPVAAMREGICGTVSMTADINENGRVSLCEISSSSGSAILDETACAAFTEYGRFTAATDGEGRSVSGPYNMAIRYSLRSTPSEPTEVRPRLINGPHLYDIFERAFPDVGPRPDSTGMMEFNVTVSDLGRVTDCAITVSSGYEEFDEMVCEEMRYTAKFTIYKTANGKGVGGVYPGTFIYLKL